jgi:hypothetical protein
MKAILSRVAANTGTALWNSTTRVTDSGGGATDVIVVRYWPPGMPPSPARDVGLALEGGARARGPAPTPLRPP